MNTNIITDIKRLISDAKELEPDYGTGFSRRQIELSRQFYRIFPIATTLYSQLSWSHSKFKISIVDV